MKLTGIEIKRQRDYDNFIKKYKITDDKIRQLVIDNEKLVYFSINKILKQLGPSILNYYEIDDLYQEGFITLIKCATIYDNTKGSSLSNYFYNSVYNTVRLLHRNQVSKLNLNISIETTIFESDNSTVSIGDLLVDDSLDFQIYIEVKELIGNVIDNSGKFRNKTKAYMIAYLTFIEGYTQREISAICNTSQSHISRILNTILEGVRLQYK